jgi:hypothetical protein
MDRILSLTRRGKVVVSVALSFVTVILAFGVFSFNKDQFVLPMTSAGTLFFFSLLVLLSERKDDVAGISRTLDYFLAHTLPSTIASRFLGEPFDPRAYDKEYCLNVAVYHKRGEHHAGYRVGTKDHSFEFTCIIGVYRIAFFIFLPLDLDKDQMCALKEVCDAFNVGKFDKPFFEKVTPSIGPAHTVVYLNKTFTDHYADFVFSPREQYWVASLVREWCRAIIRKMRYEPQRLPLLTVPLGDVTIALSSLEKQ